MVLHHMYVNNAIPPVLDTAVVSTFVVEEISSTVNVAVPSPPPSSFPSWRHAHTTQ